MPVNQESILNSIKKLLSIESTDTAFDEEIKIHINTVLSNLNQIGIGPANGYCVESSTDKWSDFINDDKLLQPVKSYVYIKVRLLFDPPTSGTLIDSLNNQAKELETRIYTYSGGY